MPRLPCWSKPMKTPCFFKINMFVPWYHSHLLCHVRATLVCQRSAAPCGRRVSEGLRAWAHATGAQADIAECPVLFVLMRRHVAMVMGFQHARNARGHHLSSPNRRRALQRQSHQRREAIPHLGRSHLRLRNPFVYPDLPPSAREFGILHGHRFCDCARHLVHLRTSLAIVGVLQMSWVMCADHGEVSYPSALLSTSDSEFRSSRSWSAPRCSSGT